MSSATFDLISTLLHWGIGSLLLVLCGAFGVFFFFPGRRLGRRLTQAHAALAALKAQGPVLDLGRVAREAMADEALAHCWQEYRDTLHPQKQADGLGTLQVQRWRATAMANAFFTEHSLVDTRLHTEFFKHLPGILTGLGIIGTFSGLILGLQGFEVTADAEVVRKSLATLIQSVGGAFVVSGIAIALAMAATFAEKIVINRRYAQVEKLCGLIDSLFDAGAGEEYLQRLVEASETAATQAMQMKESLVTDLKQVLTELTQQQIATMTATSTQLGQQITASLSEGLKEPLDRISNAVQTVGGHQGEAVNKLLTDVLTGFTAQMEHMFGSQMRGMNEVLQRTADTIQTASQRFEQLAGTIEQAGSGAADAMARRMEELMSAMSARQAEANAQMAAFIDGLKQSVAQGQSETAEQTRRMLQELSDSMGGVVRQLQERAQADAQQHGARQQEAAELTRKLLSDLAQSTGDLVQRLQAQAHDADSRNEQRQRQLAEQFAAAAGAQQAQSQALVDATGQAAAAMREAIDRLQGVTSSSIDRMNLGADKLQAASLQLTSRLDDMRDAASGLGGTAEKLQGAGAGLSASLTATQQALADQKQVRDALAAMVSDLRTTVENAKREAGMTRELVDSLNIASQRLVDAQRSAEGYLEGVNDVLEETHAAFARQLELTLRTGNAKFQEELTSAVRVLKAAVIELGELVERLPARV